MVAYRWRTERLEEAERRQRIREAMRLPEVQSALKACPVQHFVTLTTKEPLDFWGLSAALTEVFQIVNEKLFGKRRARHGFGLVTFVVQERSCKQGLHIHMLVGVPDGCLTLKTHPCRIPVPQLIVDTWLSRGSRRIRHEKGQDAQKVYYLEGAAACITKHLKKTDDIENVDVFNTHFPTAYR